MKPINHEQNRIQRAGLVSGDFRRLTADFGPIESYRLRWSRVFVGGTDEKACRLVGDHCKNIGLEVTTVTVLSPEENPISPDTKVREKSIEKLKWVLDRAADLNSQVLCGPFHSAFATFASRAPIEDEYNWSAEVLHEVGDYGKKLGILMTPEALNRFECYLANTMEQLDYLLAKVNHPNVQAMFDTHHANMEEKNLGQQ